jgi:hypothetical protein
VVVKSLMALHDHQAEIAFAVVDQYQGQVSALH